jgi:hypothetical protein
MNAVFLQYRRNASTRGLNFDLSVEEFHLISQMGCFYCGAKPTVFETIGRFNGKYTGNGIDRLDSNKGYTPDNSAPCCFTCNRAKSNMTVEQYLQWIARSAKHLKAFLIEVN